LPLHALLRTNNALVRRFRLLVCAFRAPAYCAPHLLRVLHYCAHTADGTGTFCLPPAANSHHYGGTPPPYKTARTTITVTVVQFFDVSTPYSPVATAPRPHLPHHAARAAACTTPCVTVRTCAPAYRYPPPPCCCHTAAVLYLLVTPLPGVSAHGAHAMPAALLHATTARHTPPCHGFLHATCAWVLAAVPACNAHYLPYFIPCLSPPAATCLPATFSHLDHCLASMPCHTPLPHY